MVTEDYDVSLCQRVGIHNYYTKDHIITCDRCTFGKFYSFVRWITWWQVTADEDAWRPLIRYGITSIYIYILCFCGDSLSCAYPGIYEIGYFTSFQRRELYFKKDGKCMQMTTKYVFTMKNGEHVVYFLNIINLLSFQVWSRSMTSFKKRKCIHGKNAIFEFILLRTVI